MKTIAICLIAGASLTLTNHSFAQIRLGAGGAARVSSGARISTPGINNALRAGSATTMTTARSTVNAGQQATAKTVSTTGQAVKTADQTHVNASAATSSSAAISNKSTESNAGTKVKTGANVQAAGSVSAGKQ